MSKTVSSGKRKEVRQEYSQSGSSHIWIEWILRVEGTGRANRSQQCSRQGTGLTLCLRTFQSGLLGCVTTVHINLSSFSGCSTLKMFQTRANPYQVDSSLFPHAHLAYFKYSILTYLIFFPEMHSEAQNTEEWLWWWGFTLDNISYELSFSFLGSDWTGWPSLSAFFERTSAFFGHIITLRSL